MNTVLYSISRTSTRDCVRFSHHTNNNNQNSKILEGETYTCKMFIVYRVLIVNVSGLIGFRQPIMDTYYDHRLNTQKCACLIYTDFFVFSICYDTLFCTKLLYCSAFGSWRNKKLWFSYIKHVHRLHPKYKNTILLGIKGKLYEMVNQTMWSKS